jgi:hypothetical protein
MVTGSDLIPLTCGLLGAVGGAAWGSRYGLVRELIGGIAGLPLGFVTGSLYHSVVFDLIGGWAAGLVERRRRIGVPIFVAWYLIQLALVFGLLLLLVVLPVRGWLARERRAPRPKPALQQTRPAASSINGQSDLQLTLL